MLTVMNKIKYYNQRRHLFSFHIDVEQYSIAISHCGSFLATGGINDAKISLWCLKTGKIWKSWLAHPLSPYSRDENRIYSLAISCDGKTLVSSGALIQAWDVETGQLLRTFKGGGWGLFAALNNQGDLLVTGDEVKTIFWKMSNGRKIRRRYGSRGKIIDSVCINSDDTEIVEGDFDNEIKVWDLKVGNLIRLMEAGGATKVHDLSLDDQDRFLIGFGFHGIQIWDYQTGKRIGSINKFNYEKRYYQHLDIVLRAEISPDSNSIVSLGKDGRIRVWNVLSTNHCMILETQNPTSDFRFNADHSVLVTCSDDRQNFEVYEFS
jgi:WD40 repeat protein